MVMWVNEFESISNVKEIKNLIFFRMHGNESDN